MTTLPTYNMTLGPTLKASTAALFLKRFEGLLLDALLLTVALIFAVCTFRGSAGRS